MDWYTQRKHAQHDYPRLFETSIENGEKKERERIDSNRNIYPIRLQLIML